MSQSFVCILSYLLSLSLLTSPLLAQVQQQPQKPPEEVLRIGAEEVLLDLIVRDKKGRPVSDLKAADIEIYEDGVRQSVSSFRAINRTAEAMIDSANTSAAPGVKAIPGTAKTADVARQINLVSFVFERLSPDGRRNAKMAAMEFLKEDYGPNVMVAVFSLDQRLNVVQSFTSDRERIKAAIERVIGMAPSAFAGESQKIKQELENFTKADATARAIAW